MNSVTTHPKILIVDDNPANLLALEATLGNKNYALVRAESGREALHQALSHDFAVILLDVQMPVLDGFQTAQHLRALPGSKHTPIIFLTANYPTEGYALQGYEAGAVDYLIKPLNMDMLRAKVAVFVELFKTNLENRRQAEEIAEMRRREVEHEKKITERRYRNLVEGIRDGIVWAADCKMETFSFISRYAVRIAGYPLVQWQEEPRFWEKHLHPDDRERVLGAFRKILETREPFVLEHRFLKPGGETIWFHTGVHLDNNNSSDELRGLSVDITHLKETERALRDAIQTRDEFLSIASHELRTPITPLQLQMQGFIRLIETGKLEGLPPETLREMLLASDSQVARLARLISQLLDISRLSGGRFKLEIVNTNLSDLVRGVMDQLHHEIQASECPLTLDLADGLRGDVDPLRLEQVIINLMTNSLKYGPGKPIKVTLKQSGSVAHFSIRDEGIGIAPQDYGRIFERFERAVSPRHYGGLGLGLYISAQIVELHRGRIWVESELGKGATFHVELPISSPPHENKRRSDERGTAENNTRH